MADWFLRLGDQCLGPFTSKQFAEMAVDGRLTPTDSIRRGDMANWVPATKLQGLSFPPELPPPPVEPVAPPQMSTLVSLATAERKTMTPAGILDLLRSRPSFAVLGTLLIASFVTIQWPLGKKSAVSASSGFGSVSSTSKNSNTGDFPLSWQGLLRMTGEGEGTKKYYDADDKLKRIESRYGIQVLVAVEAVGEGFAVAVANELAVADFTTRPWFSRQETQTLQNLYAEFVADTWGSKVHRATLPRFEVTMRRDRRISSYACFELQPRSD